MTTVTKWIPLGDLFSSRRSSCCGDTSVRASDGTQESWINQAEWTPLVDISEDDKEYVIKAELPEIEKENVKISVENGTLILRGERKLEKEVNDKKFHRVERAYGSFIRSFVVPDDADGEKIRAEFKNGVLSVHLPKSEQAKPRSIDIQVS
jgi:HSP20 family protein